MADPKIQKETTWESILKPVVVLLAICIIIPLALALTNRVTKDPIAEQEAQQRADSMAELFPEASFRETDGYAVAEADGETVGYIFTTAAKGYGGDVKVMTALLRDGAVKAVKILSVDDETPGLGQNATNESFYGQFAGMPNGEISINKIGADPEKGEITPITGATITSTAVKNAVNEAMAQYEKISSGEGGNES